MDLKLKFAFDWLRHITSVYPTSDFEVSLRTDMYCDVTYSLIQWCIAL